MLDKSQIKPVAIATGVIVDTLVPFIDEQMRGWSQADTWRNRYLVGESTAVHTDPSSDSVLTTRNIFRLIREEVAIFDEVDSKQRQQLKEADGFLEMVQTNSSLDDQILLAGLDCLADVLEFLNFYDEAEHVKLLRADSQSVAGSKHSSEDADQHQSSSEIPEAVETEVLAPEGEFGAVVALQGNLQGLNIQVVLNRIWVFERLHRRESPLLTLEASNASDVQSLPATVTFNAVFEGDGTSVGAPFSVEIPSLKPQESISIPAPRRRWIPSGEKFLSISEGSRATAFISLAVAGTVQKYSTEITMLPADQWWAAGGELNLVAFVRPNDSEIGALLREASDLLLSRTGSASLDGYQTSEERVHQIAHAIYDAMLARKIAYMEPPASFYNATGAGQRVRSPYEVLVERRGTCLDLATTYAAALEQAGISPFLVVMTGHAFAGYRTVESARAAEILTDAGLISNALAMEGIEVVETTDLCERSNPISFDEARGSARRTAIARRESLTALIDVQAAHRWIPPLPTMRWDGETRVIEKIITREAAPEREFTSTTESLRPGDKSPIRIARWKRGLLDLTFRNPLLRLQKRSSTEILVSPKSLGQLEDMLDDGVTLTLHHSDRASELIGDLELVSQENSSILLEQMARNRVLFTAHTEREYRRRLTALQRKAKEDLQESGADSLYLGIGTLEWEDGPRQGKAPLFLIPVRLLGGKGSTAFGLSFDSTREFQPNFCLDEKLRTGYGIDLPELINPGNDSHGLDIDGALKRIRGKLVDAEAKTFRVSETVFLANLKFASIDLWRDLEENWPSFMQRPVVKHLVENAGAPFNDGIEVPPPADSDEAKLRLPIPADGSQIDAIRWADTGKTFVLEGPPGTGKSQTITNLIAHLLSQGKKVLFVAEKQAALDVVGRRLESVGLDPLSLNLHGKDQSPMHVRAQLQQAIDYAPGAVPGFNSAQIAYQSLAQHLAVYPRKVHEEGPAGQSTWEAHGVVMSSVPDEIFETCDVEIPRSLVLSRAKTQEANDAAWALFEALANLSEGVRNPVWVLADADTDAAAQVDLELLHRTLNDLFGSIARLDAVEGIPEFLTSDLGKAEKLLLAKWADRSQIPDTPKIGDAARIVTDQWKQQVEELRDYLERYGTSHRTVMQMLTYEAARTNPAPLQSELAESTKNFFTKKKRRGLFAASLEQYLLEGQPAIDPGKIERFLSDWTSGFEMLTEQILPAVQRIDGITVHSNFEPLDQDHVRDLFEQTDKLIEIAEFTEAQSFRTHESIWVGIGDSSLNGDEILALDTHYSVLKNLLNATERTEELWLEGRSWVEAALDSKSRWLADAQNTTFLSLQRWFALQNALARFDALEMPGIREQVEQEELTASNAAISIKFAIDSAIEQERMETTGLSGFDSKRRERQVDSFMASAAQIRSMLSKVVPNEIIAKRTIDVNSAVGQVGLLRQQLGRRRGGLSIRELMHRYGNTIAQLTPCFLMSPASVARFLPSTGMEFDVVVFDEASQIRVPEAIGAMGRGKSVVVVGDSQQMPPSSMFGASIADEDDDDTLESELFAPQDMESILSEAVESAIPRRMLTWHYRSKDESLIAFSNVHYYEEKLSSFPAPPIDTVENSAVEFRNVHGLWEGGSGRSANRVNRSEAQAVVREVISQLTQHPGSSIGVVTFNKPQQELVLDLLDEAALDNPVLEQALERETDEIFVKNLENVQGDERDTILFTLAFSKDDKGKIPLNWGPLTRQGGEKRLNVAVTRAKERVIVFGSFEPHELDTTRSNSTGLKHLRDYLMTAKNGVSHLAKTREDDLGAHAADIRQSLVDSGFEVISNVGLSDFTVDFAVRSDIDRPWIAVLLDGPAWFERRSVGDRDALPHSVLVKQMGWVNTYNVWLPEWIRDKAAVISQIREMADNARILEPVGPIGTDEVSSLDQVEKTQDSSTSEQAISPQVDSGSNISLDVWTSNSEQNTSATPSIRVQYRHAGEDQHNEFTFESAVAAEKVEGNDSFVPASDKTKYDKSWLDDKTGKGRERLQNELLDVLKTESPVLLSRLAKIVSSRYDFGRLVPTRQQEILRELPKSHILRSANGDQVAWQDVSEAEHYSLYRTGNDRTLSEIPYEELLNAMKTAVILSDGLNVEDAMRETARLFDVNRMGRAVKDRMESVLKAAISDGSLTMRDDLLHVPQN